VKVFVAGATGVLGRRLVAQLLSRGHSVVALARSSENEQKIQSMGAESRRGNILDADSLVKAAEGADVVVHAATAIPKTVRWNGSEWLMNDRIRREGTRALTDCTAKVGAKQYLQQSIVWVARPPDGSPFDESSPTNLDPANASAIDGERIAQEAGEKHGFSVSVLRCGWFYAHDASHTLHFRDRLLKRRLPIIGKGDALLSLIHADDAAAAFVAVVEKGMKEEGGGRRAVWHIVDDEPTRFSDFLLGFVGKIGAPRPRRVPTWLARIIAGNETVNFLTASVQTSNGPFKRQVGWSPRYPNFKMGLEEVVEAWKKEGFFEAR
jgi:nucleoside-diphosphate-sugar epimerase